MSYWRQSQIAHALGMGWGGDSSEILGLDRWQWKADSLAKKQDYLLKDSE